MRSFFFLVPSFSFSFFLNVFSHASSFFLSTSFFSFFWLPGMEMLIFNLGFQAGSRWFDTSSSGTKSTSMVGRRARRTRASRRQDYITTIPFGRCDLRHQHPPPAPSSPTSPSPIRRFFKYAISSPTLAPCLFTQKASFY